MSNTCNYVFKNNSSKKKGEVCGRRLNRSDCNLCWEHKPKNRKFLKQGIEAETIQSKPIETEIIETKTVKSEPDFIQLQNSSTYKVPIKKRKKYSSSSSSSYDSSSDSSSLDSSLSN